MLLKEFIELSCRELQSLYPPHEARSIVALYCRDRFGFESYAHILDPSLCLPPQGVKDAMEDLGRLASGEPVQYVTGKAEFCGRTFKVDGNVLVPRPETEQMVSMSLPSIRPSSRVLDICTGSGCIAWTAALDVPGSDVVAVDVSCEALSVAAVQFEGNPPLFLCRDVLSKGWTEGLGEFDFIFSNPPYIKEGEKAGMRRNVLEYEPALALFVPDSDPLVFYRAVAGAAAELLKEGGGGIVEVNETLAGQTAGVFVDAGLKNVHIVKDFFNKERFVKFEK